jgi:hypothetical protein
MRGIAFALTATLTAAMLTGVPGAGAGDSMFLTAESLVSSQAKTLSGDQGADIFGVGGGKVNGGMQKFDFSAHEGPNGDFGHVSVTFTDLLGNPIVTYSANVTCVSIHTPAAPLAVGAYDRGIIRGVIKRVSPESNLVGLNVGDAVVFGIRDGGNPSAPMAVDDFFAPNSDALPAGVPCRELYYMGELDNVTQGNVSIKGP